MGKNSPNEATEANQAVRDVRKKSLTGKRSTRKPQRSEGGSVDSQRYVTNEDDLSQGTDLSEGISNTKASVSTSDLDSSPTRRGLRNKHLKDVPSDNQKSDRDISPKKQAATRESLEVAEQMHTDEEDMEDVFDTLDYKETLRSKMSLGRENRRRRWEEKERARREVEAKAAEPFADVTSPEPCDESTTGNNAHFKRPPSTTRRKRKRKQPQRVIVDDSRGETSSDDGVVTSDSDRPPRRAMVPPRRASTDSSSDGASPMGVGEVLRTYEVECGVNPAGHNSRLSPRSRAVIDRPDIDFNSALELVKQMNHTPPRNSSGDVSPHAAHSSTLSTQDSARLVSTHEPSASEGELVTEKEQTSRPPRSNSTARADEVSVSKPTELQKRGTVWRNTGPKFFKSRQKTSEVTPDVKPQLPSELKPSPAAKPSKASPPVPPEEPVGLPAADLEFVETLCSESDEEQEVIVYPVPLPKNPVPMSCRPSSPASARPPFSRSPVRAKADSPRWLAEEKPPSEPELINIIVPLHSTPDEMALDDEVKAAVSTRRASRSVSNASSSVGSQSEAQVRGVDHSPIRRRTRSSVSSLASEEHVHASSPDACGSRLAHRVGSKSHTAVSHAAQNENISGMDALFTDVDAPLGSQISHSEYAGVVSEAGELSSGFPGQPDVPFAENSAKPAQDATLDSQHSLLKNATDAASDPPSPLLTLSTAVPTIAESVKTSRSKRKQTARKHTSPKAVTRRKSTAGISEGNLQRRRSSQDKNGFDKIKEVLKKVTLDKGNRDVKPSGGTGIAGTTESDKRVAASHVGQDEANSDTELHMKDDTGCDDPLIDLSSIQSSDRGMTRPKKEAQESPPLARVSPEVDQTAHEVDTKLPEEDKNQSKKREKEEERVITIYVPLKQAAATVKQGVLKNSKCWPGSSRRMRKEDIETSDSSSGSDTDYPTPLSRKQKKAKNTTPKSASRLQKTAKSVDLTHATVKVKTGRSRKAKVEAAAAKKTPAEKEINAEPPKDKFRLGTDKVSSSPQVPEKGDDQEFTCQVKPDLSPVGTGRTLRREIHKPKRYEDSDIPDLGSLRMQSPEHEAENVFTAESRVEADNQVEKVPPGNKPPHRKSRASPSQSDQTKGGTTLADKKRSTQRKKRSKGDDPASAEETVDSEKELSASQKLPLKKRLVPSAQPDGNESSDHRMGKTDGGLPVTERQLRSGGASPEKVSGGRGGSQAQSKPSVDAISRKLLTNKTSVSKRTVPNEKESAELGEEGRTSTSLSDADAPNEECSAVTRPFVTRLEETDGETWFDTDSAVQYHQGMATRKLQGTKEEADRVWRHTDSVKLGKEIIDQHRTKLGKERLNLKFFTEFDIDEYCDNMKKQPFKSTRKRTTQHDRSADRRSAHESESEGEAVVLHQIEVFKDGVGKILRIKEKTKGPKQRSVRRDRIRTKESAKPTVEKDVPVENGELSPVDANENLNAVRSQLETHRNSEERARSDKNEDEESKLENNTNVSKDPDCVFDAAEEAKNTLVAEVSRTTQEILAESEAAEKEGESPSRATDAPEDEADAEGGSPGVKPAEEDESEADTDGSDVSAHSTQRRRHRRSSHASSLHGSGAPSRRSSCEARDDKTGDMSEVDFSMLDNPLDTDTESGLQVSQHSDPANKISV